MRTSKSVKRGRETPLVGGSAERPRTEGKKIVRRPWAGTFGEYAVVGGVRIPTHGEVRWELPDGAFTHWRGTVTSLELSFEDPTRC